MKTTTNAAGLSASETTDVFGRTVARTDFGNHVYSYVFDAGGRLIRQLNSLSYGETYAMGLSSGTQGEVDYGYFNTGAVATITGGTRAAGASAIASNAVTTYGYDQIGERTIEKYQVLKGGVWTTEETASVAYDAAGRMTSYIDRGAEDGRDVTIAWEYDQAGNVRRMTANYDLLDSQGLVYTAPRQDYYYLYDQMNRFTTVKGMLSGGQIVRGLTGTDISWNLDGTRATATYQVTDANDVSHAHEEDYGYSDNGYLDRVNFRTDGGSAVTAAVYQRDAMGRVTDYKEYAANGSSVQYERSASYDARSNVDKDTVTTVTGGDTTVTDTNYSYQLDGVYQGGRLVHSSNVVTVNGQGASSSYSDYGVTWWDSAQTAQLSYTLHRTANPEETQVSTYKYDALGHLGSVHIADGRPRDVSFLTDATGTILERDEADANSGTGDPRDLYYYFNGMRVGDISNNGTSDTDYVASMKAHIAVAPATPGPFRGGATTGTPYADFDQAFDPINGLTYESTSSRYTVQAGDTLQTIAQTVWGDSSLWYLIADANGLDGSENLAPGRDLIIPNKVHNAHNTSDVYRVYDPNEAIGNNSPTTPKPAPTHHGGGCGAFGQILLAAVAIAVTIALAVSVVGAPAAAGVQATGLTALLGGTSAAAGSAAAIGAGVIGGALAGAAGSIVSQGLGVLTGLQDRFSFKGVALSAISGAVGGGLGGSGILSGASGATQVAEDIARGALGSALSQGIGIAVGLQHQFDFTSVAVAGVASGAFGIANRTLAAGPHGFGVASGTAGPHDFGYYANNALSGAAGAIVGAASRSLINGSDFGDNIVRVLPDVIAQTVGSIVADRLVGGGRPQIGADTSDPTDASIAQYQAMYNAGDLSDGSQAYQFDSDGAITPILDMNGSSVFIDDYSGTAPLNSSFNLIPNENITLLSGPSSFVHFFYNLDSPVKLPDTISYVFKRSAVYASMNESLNSSGSVFHSSFFFAASSVTDILGLTGAQTISNITGYPFDASTLIHVQDLGASLYHDVNLPLYRALYNGDSDFKLQDGLTIGQAILSPEGLDYQIVHSEQTYVQNFLNSLLPSDRSSFIMESTRALQNSNLSPIIASALRGLGHPFNFATQGDREAIGLAEVAQNPYRTNF